MLPYRQPVDAAQLGPSSRGGYLAAMIVDGIIDIAVIGIAVIGIADKTWGEVPLLILHTNTGRDTARDTAAIIADVERIGREQLAVFKRPKYAVISKTLLPRTFSGKLSKPQLRQIYREPPSDAIPLFKRTR